MYYVFYMTSYQAIIIGLHHTKANGQLEDCLLLNMGTNGYTMKQQSVE